MAGGQKTVTRRRRAPTNKDRLEVPRQAPACRRPWHRGVSEDAALARSEEGTRAPAPSWARHGGGAWGDGASSYIRTKTPLTANGVDVLQHPQAPALPQRGRAEGQAAGGARREPGLRRRRGGRVKAEGFAKRTTSEVVLLRSARMVAAHYGSTCNTSRLKTI